MHSKLTLFSSLAALLLVAPAIGQPGATEMTREVSGRYLALDIELDYEALAALYAPDAQFFDPTAEVFSGPIAEGVIRGAESILAVQRGWGLAGCRFDEHGSIVVGDQALHRGRLEVRFEGSERWVGFPFVTTHRVRDGKVVERLDFGEYVASFGMGDAYDAQTASTRAIADRYLEAYFGRDLSTTAELLAPDARTEDPTARVFGPPAGEPKVGKERILESRRRLFEKLVEFGFSAEESFYVNHHAVVAGRTTYVLGDQRYDQPAVFVVEVRDGLVTRQWDFVDYTVPPTTVETAEAR